MPDATTCRDPRRRAPLHWSRQTPGTVRPIRSAPASLVSQVQAPHTFVTTCRPPKPALASIVPFPRVLSIALPQIPVPRQHFMARIWVSATRETLFCAHRKRERCYGQTPKKPNCAELPSLISLAMASCGDGRDAHVRQLKRRHSRRILCRQIWRQRSLSLGTEPPAY